MTDSTPASPFDQGYQAYRNGQPIDDANPFHNYESPDQWDEFIDGWATARLDVFQPWREQGMARLGLTARCVLNLGECFDDGLTPDEAIDKNRHALQTQHAEG